MNDNENNKILDIIYEDEYIFGVNKPSGVVVNRSHTYIGTTLQDMVEEKYPFLKIHKNNDVHDQIQKNTPSSPESLEDEDAFTSDYIERSGIVHRLDKDTSGVVLCAKNEEVFKNLQKQFKSREVKKEYSAIVFNKIEDEIIEINAPIGRNPKNPFKFAVVSEGKSANTKIFKIKEKEIDNKLLTYIKITPKSGRTHQIRVHLTALGNSVVHDEIYNTKNQLEWSQKHFNRLMLHASSIEFMHPIKKKSNHCIM